MTISNDSRARASISLARLQSATVIAVAIVALAVTLLWNSIQPTPSGAIPGGGQDGAWSELADWPINAIHMSLTPDGDILSFGRATERGLGGAYLDLWNPEAGLSDGSHQVVAHDTNTKLFCAFAVSAPDGASIFIIGGDTYYGNQNSFTTEFRDDSLTSLPRMNDRRWYPTATTLPDGRLLVQGGNTGGSFGTPATTPEIFNGSQWISLPGARSDALYKDDYGWWYPRSWVTPAGKVFNIAQNEMYYLDPNGPGGIERLGTFPEIAVGGTSASVQYESGKVLQVGGGELNSDHRDYRATKQAVVIDMNFDPPLIERVADMNYARHWATALVLADGKVLVMGGSGINNEDEDVVYHPEIWDPQTNTWTILEANSTMRLYHQSAVLLPDGSVISSGGGEPGPVTNRNGEIFYPPNLYNADGSEAERLTLFSTPSDVTYSETFTANADGPVSRVTLIKAQNSTHSMNTQVFQELEFTQSGDQLTMVAPSLSTVATPGMYLLQVLDENGIPSESRIVNLVGEGASRPSTPLPAPDSLINGSFESPNVKDGHYRKGDVPGWQSSDGDQVETWGYDHRDLDATEGDQVAQINVGGSMSIWQDVATEPGMTYEWSFDHRGASSDDTVELSIGGSVVGSFTTGDNAWETYSGTWVVPPGMTTARFSLRGVDSSGFANMLDDVRFDPVGLAVPPTPIPVPPTPTAVPPTPTPAPPTITELTDSVPVGPLAGSTDSETFFTIDVPAGTSALEVAMTGAGDADLYVRAAAPPTQDDWDCRPYIDGSSDETCTIPEPAAGTWHVMVRGWADYDATSIIATFADSPPPPATTPTLANGETVTGLAGDADSTNLYMIDIPAGTQELTVAMTGAGDADLYVQGGSEATLSNWTCRPYIDGTSTETCTISAPAAGPWYVLVHGYTSFSDTSVVATWSDTTDLPVLTPGVSSDALSGSQGDEAAFVIDVPADAAQLTVTMTGAGDADLYVNFGSAPTTAVWECRPYLDGSSNETCTIDAPAAGTWHIMVRGWAAFSDTTVTADLAIPAAN